MSKENAAPANGKGFRDAVPHYNGTDQVDRAGHKLPFTAPADVAPLFMKGNEAIVHGALLAGCRAYFGYPITPASEIAHTAAALFPPTGGVFLQAESEVAAINMVYGAASTGVRCHDRLELAGHQPQAGGHQLRRGCRAADGDRRHHARRPGPGEHRARAGRLLPDGQGRRTRLLPHAGPRAELLPGDVRPDDARLRDRGSLPHADRGPRRRTRRSDEGAGLPARPGDRSPGQDGLVGAGRRQRRAKTSSARSSSPPTNSRTTSRTSQDKYQTITEQRDAVGGIQASRTRTSSSSATASSAAS